MKVKKILIISLLAVSTTVLLAYVGPSEPSTHEINKFLTITVLVIVAVLIIQYYIIESAVLSAMQKHDKNKQKEVSDKLESNG